MFVGNPIQDWQDICLLNIRRRAQEDWIWISNPFHRFCGLFLQLSCCSCPDFPYAIQLWHDMGIQFKNHSCLLPKWRCNSILFGQVLEPVLHISITSIPPCTLGLAKFFRVKSANPHVEIWVKRWVQTNFERPRSISYHVTHWSWPF